MSEDDFRDQLVRPLFIRKKLQHGAELCGADEAGKDCFFRESAPFGPDRIVVVQTKIGNLNMGAEPSRNVARASTQMLTALESTVQDLKQKTKRLPNSGYLCVSGKISDQAKQHIIDQVKSANLFFLDIDDLIPEVDENFPEFWHGIGAERIPYLKALENRLLNESEFSSLSALIKNSETDSPVSDNGFVPLRLSRSFLKPKKVNGRITQEPDFEELRIEALLPKEGVRFLIIGEAGSGKSTLLKRAAELLCRAAMHDKSAPIPVFLKAINIASSKQTLAEDAFRTSESIAPNLVAAFSTADMASGSVFILIDALDEIGSQISLDAFLAKLAVFNSEFPKCRVILTSRNYSYISKNLSLAGYSKYNVAPIGLKEASKIIANLGKKKLFEKEKGTEIMRQLESIHGFELNPLVVTVFAASADSGRKDIPCNITELFAKFTELLLGRWDSDKGLSQQYESGLKSLLLERVAYKMHVAKKTRLPCDEFREMISEELEELGHKSAKIDILMEEIIDRSSLLREFDGFTEFTHLLIQEFFAGKAIKDDTQLISLAKDEWWKRPIVFYFGNNPDNAGALHRLCRTDIAPTSSELFNLSTLLGLATQACYFVKVRDKCKIIDWVIRALAMSTMDLLKENKAAKFPIHDFLFAYLSARDSVGADCTVDLHQESEAGDEADELEEFWLIVGLMEPGHLTEALERLKLLKAKHPLPFVALHMGAFLIEHVRGVSKEKKNVARQLREYVEPRAVPLFKNALKEYKSALLEIQKGVVIELNENDVSV